MIMNMTASQTWTFIRTNI